jgi:hypothetical protein
VQEGGCRRLGAALTAQAAPALPRPAPKRLQKANRARQKPLSGAQRRKMRRVTGESGNEGEEVGEEAGEEAAHEALTAMLAGQVTAPCVLGVWWAGRRGLVAPLLPLTNHARPLCCTEPRASGAVGRTICADPPTAHLLLPLQRPPSARLAARKRPGQADSDYDDEEERERPRKKAKSVKRDGAAAVNGHARPPLPTVGGALQDACFRHQMAMSSVVAPLVFC